MADSNTETTATPASDGTSTDHGSEFSKPTGAKDDEVWAKHFGKEAKESKPDKPKPKTTADGQKRGETSKSDASGDKSRSAKPSKDSASATSDSGKPISDKDPSKPKESKSPKKDDDSAATGQKTADDDKETDPEAPSRKAKDLYAEAKKAEDPREARKLYKRAMREAFGEVPPEFDDGKYAAVRKERSAAKAALAAQAEKNEGRIREAADKLKPAIYVMRQLESAKIADKLTVPMVERTIHVMRALQSLEQGDYTQLAEVISRAAGVDHDEAMKRFVKGVKVSPEGKAARAAADEARREAAETRAQLAELQRKLAEKDSAQTEAQKKQEQARKVQESREAYLENIETELEGHPVLALPRGRERVLAYLIKTAHPTLKTPRFSFEAAADRVVAHEKKRLQAGRHLLDDGDEAPAAPTSGTRRLTSVSRAETADVGVRPTDPIARFEEIFDKHAAAGGQRRRGR